MVDGIEVEIVEDEEEERDAEPQTDDEVEETEDEGVSEDDEDDEDDDDEESDESETSTDEEEDEGGEEEESEETDQITVTIGDEKTEPDDEQVTAPQWVKDLRKQRKADAKRIKELEKQLERPTQREELGAKPTLESSGFDADIYEADIAKWFAKKRKIEADQEEANRAKVEAQKEADAKYAKYNTDKAALKVPDFAEAEEVVIDTLSEQQQGAILQGSADPALLVYALGKSEKQANKLAQIKDPVKFIFAVAKLEAQLKVSKGKPKPKPEGKVRGSGRTNSPVDSQLERLRAKAEKTGDYTEVIAYKKKHRSKD